MSKGGETEFERTRLPGGDLPDYKQLLTGWLTGPLFDRLVEALGEKGFKLLLMLILAQLAHPLARQQAKSRSIRQVRFLLSVSAQQARTYRRRIAEAMMNSKDPDIIALRYADCLTWLFPVRDQCPPDHV